jgi:hypothetical protein
MDRDSLVAVAEDLEYLSTWGPSIPDADIRRGSAVLRRLLVEDAYGTAWRTAGFEQQPSLIAVDFYRMLGTLPLQQVTAGLAGGARFRGMFFAGFINNKAPGAPNGFSPPLRNDGYPCERAFTLSELLKSPSGAVDGRPFERREVIKYIANVKGGVHLSAQRRKAEAKLVARMGKMEKRLVVNGTEGLLFELVAIGQALGQSEDARKYIARVRA